MKIMKPAILLPLAALLAAGCGKSGSDSVLKSTNDTTSPLTAPVDYLGALHKGQVSAEKTVDTASINKAVQLFNIEEGRNPKDLNELVEGRYMPSIPKPPYGMEIRYDAASGKVSIVAKPK
jgi:hypothetical protein